MVFTSILIITRLRILELERFFLKLVPLFFRFPKYSFTPKVIESLLIVNYDEVLKLYWQPRCDIVLMTNGHIKV